MINNTLLKAVDRLAEAISTMNYHLNDPIDQANVYSNLDRYASEILKLNEEPATRKDRLIEIINETVDGKPYLSAEEIADAIIEAGL